MARTDDRVRTMKTVTLIGTLITTLLLSGCGAISDADEKVFLSHRTVDSLERQFSYLASAIDSSKPCFLIHPRSISVAPFSSDGTKVSFARSRCFKYVATHTGDESLCQHVRSVSTFLYSGEKLNASHCRELAAHGSHVRWPSGGLDVQEIVSLAGFALIDIDRFFVASEVYSSMAEAAQQRVENSAGYWNEVRFNFLHSREFFDRIDQMPGFADSRDRANMAAIPWRPRSLSQFD